MLRNWIVVCAGNLVGAAGWRCSSTLRAPESSNGGRLGQQALRVVAAKSALPVETAFFKGVLCNVLVCMAIWMAAAAAASSTRQSRSMPPIAAFVALGFEHSIANMFFFPLAMLLDPQHALAIARAMLGQPGPGHRGQPRRWQRAGGGVYWVIYEREASTTALPP